MNVRKSCVCDIKHIVDTLMLFRKKVIVKIKLCVHMQIILGPRLGK